MKTIRLSGSIGWEITADDLKRRLPPHQSGEAVRIELYSHGGNVYEGLEIYNILKDYPGRVVVVCGALVASAATNIAIAADELVVRQTTSWMIHEPWLLMIGSAD